MASGMHHRLTIAREKDFNLLTRIVIMFLKVQIIRSSHRVSFTRQTATTKQELLCLQTM